MQIKCLHLLSKELDKYEFLTGEDLGYKPGVIRRGFNKRIKKKKKKK